MGNPLSFESLPVDFSHLGVAHFLFYSDEFVEFCYSFPAHCSGFDDGTAPGYCQVGYGIIRSFTGSVGYYWYVPVGSGQVHSGVGVTEGSDLVGFDDDGVGC